MSQVQLYLILGCLLWLLGLHGLVQVQHALRRIIALNIMSSGVFMVMVALATRTNPVDPVLQALVVTGLVVAISATAFALRLAVAEAQTASPKVPINLSPPNLSVSPPSRADTSAEVPTKRKDQQS